MYEALVARVRYHIQKANFMGLKEAESTLLLGEAADAIEELMRFAHFVAREVVVTDEEWELNNLAFPEIICRKLNNLGVVSKDGELWHYEPSIGANLRRGSTKSCGCLRRDKLRERRNAKRQQNNT